MGIRSPAIGVTEGADELASPRIVGLARLFGLHEDAGHGLGSALRWLGGRWLLWYRLACGRGSEYCLCRILPDEGLHRDEGRPIGRR